jgi:hypothetical protein
MTVSSQTRVTFPPEFQTVVPRLVADTITPTVCKTSDIVSAGRDLRSPNEIRPLHRPFPCIAGDGNVFTINCADISVHSSIVSRIVSSGYISRMMLPA